MKNLEEYSKEELLDIAEQLMITPEEIGKKQTPGIITMIKEKASELSVAVPTPNVKVPEPEPSSDEPATAKPEAQKRKLLIREYPRQLVTIEARDTSVKEQTFGLNEYTCLVKIGAPVNLPKPVIDMIKTLKDVLHEEDSEGKVTSREVSRFFVTMA